MAEPLGMVKVGKSAWLLPKATPWSRNAVMAGSAPPPTPPSPQTSGPGGDGKTAPARAVDERDEPVEAGSAGREIAAEAEDHASLVFLRDSQAGKKKQNDENTQPQSQRSHGMLHPRWSPGRPATRGDEARRNQSHRMMVFLGREQGL